MEKNRETFPGKRKPQLQLMENMARGSLFLHHELDELVV